MAYAANQDIANELRSIDAFPASDKEITIAKVNAFLDEADAEINAKLQNRYVIPLVAASAEALLLLKKLEIDLVAYRIAKILNLKKDIPIPGDRTNSVIQVLNEGTAFKLAQKQLNDLNKGVIILDGATQLSTGQGVSSVVVDCDVESVIEKDKVQW